MKTFLLSLIFVLLGITTLFAQKKSVKDFYDYFIKNVPKKYEGDVPTSGYKWKVLDYDFSNGYMKFAVVDAETSEECMECPIYEMEIWKKDDTGIIVGIFQSYCGGEGCFGELDEFCFFDERWEDITEKVIDKKNILKQARSCVFKEGKEVYKPENSFFNPKTMTCQIKFSKIGTSISCTPIIPGIALGCEQIFVFDKQLGKFIF